jgi:hypothetical protein
MGENFIVVCLQRERLVGLGMWVRPTDAEVAIAFDAEAGEEVELLNRGLGELVGCGERKGVDGHGNEQ